MSIRISKEKIITIDLKYFQKILSFNYGRIFYIKKSIFYQKLYIYKNDHFTNDQAIKFI